MTFRLWPVLFPLAIFLVLTVALALAVTRHAAQPQGFARHLGDAAPVTDLPALQDQQAPFRTTDWRTKPYIVNFFASWCAPCRAEHAGLMALKQAGLPVVGIALKDKPVAIAAFLREEGNPFTMIARDTEGQTAIDWGVTGVPETFLIDGQGIIRFHQAGPLTEESIVQQLLPLWATLSP